MFDETLSSDEIKEQIDDLSYVVDEIDSAKTTLEQLDKKYFIDYIATLRDFITDVESEIDGLEEIYNDKLEEEQEEYKEEIKTMNYEFERSRA